MGAEEERIFVKELGKRSAEWSRKVDQMSDDKVIQVYLTAKEKLEETKVEEES